MMSSQPETVQLVRKFVWCQWNAQFQRLHFIENVRLDNNVSSEVSQRMSTVQFYGRAEYENMVIALNQIITLKVEIW